MQIACPNCQTAYQIADAAIGAQGRTVRCVRCQHVWHADFVEARPVPPAGTLATDTAVSAGEKTGTGPSGPLAGQTPPPATAQTGEPSLDDLVSTDGKPASGPSEAGVADAAPLALSDITIPVEIPAGGAAPSGSRGRPRARVDQTAVRSDIESVAATRKRGGKTRRKRSGLRFPLPFAIAAMLALTAGALGLRKDIVRHAPQLASFYNALGLPVNLRGLVFTDLRIGNEIQDGVPVLVVEGLIVSTTSKPLEVPRLRFALRSASGAEVYSWTAQPAQPTLGAFEALPFRSRLASPPAEGHDIQVRFFTRRDAVASLR